MKWWLLFALSLTLFDLKAAKNDTVQQHQYHVGAAEYTAVNVVAVYPSTDKIPVNLLRFYIYFSQPMREGNFLDYIHLLDENGKEITGVFFDNQYELWNEDYTRLTILIDPGRVKTGLAAHEKMGRAFEVGKKYQLHIDKNWQTINGASLDQSFIKEFKGVAAQMEGINQSNWNVELPKSGTKTALKIHFGKALDHISAQRFIVILGKNEKRLEGKVALNEDETVLSFYPSENWQSTSYQILINARLEDIVGNNLNGAFDHKIGSLKNEQEGKLERLTFVPQQLAEKSEPPAFKLFRAEENYDYLKDKENNPYKEDYLDAIKFIGLNTAKDINLRFGGEIRPRVEHFTNRNWEDDDETFYSQRIALHSNLNITQYVRLFGELYHGLVSSEEEEFAQSDQLDWHQGFLEIKLPIDKNRLSFRFGRQEMAFGATRLVGIREGPNIRRSFDMGRAIFQTNRSKTEVFYGNEVSPSFEVFDNEFSLFDADAQNPRLWGIYSQFAFKNDFGKTEVYYLGFDTPQSFFNDAVGEDIRHTLGIRRFGTIGKKLRYNTELMVQFGETAGKTTTAWAFETDWHYKFNDIDWQPELGLKLDILSGDRTNGDDNIQTFNPMFTNPGYFSLAGVIAPVNLIEFHPSIAIHPIEKLKIYLEWASFFRYSINDGVYAPPRFLNLAGQQTDERFIGNQLGFQIDYELDRHFGLALDFSYFIIGGFLESTGNDCNMMHIAPTLSYKF